MMGGHAPNPGRHVLLDCQLHLLSFFRLPGCLFVRPFLNVQVQLLSAQSESEDNNKKRDSAMQRQIISHPGGFW
jgi:hypothetical protein